jgi:sugar lactone lactonase YvrE
MSRQRQPLRRTPPRSRRLAALLLATGTGAGLSLGALVARADPGDPPGTIRTVAGTTRNYSQQGFSGDGGPAKDAQVYNPRAVAFGRSGDVFIADALNHRIRRIDSNGIISTIAGNPPPGNGAPAGGFSGDGGPATQAQLNQPHGVAVDSHGNVYVADSLNNRIRRINFSNGVIQTIAGSDEKHGQPDGPAATAILKFPKSLFMTPDDVLYVCNTGGNEIIKMDVKVQPLTITRVAGNSQSKSYGGDGGFATDAQLHHPEGMWVMPDRTVYISDSENNLVRKVGPDGKISTIAGDTAAAERNASSQGAVPGSSDGDGGPAIHAHLNVPRGIAADAAGNIYVAEEKGERIRRIDPSGIITTIAGTGQTKAQGHNPRIPGDPGPAPALEAQFDTIHELNIDHNGDLWVADSKNNRVRVISDPGHAPAGNPGSAPPPQQESPPPPPQSAPPPQQQSPPPPQQQSGPPPPQQQSGPPPQQQSSPPPEQQQSPPPQEQQSSPPPQQQSAQQQGSPPQQQSGQQRSGPPSKQQSGQQQSGPSRRSGQSSATTTTTLGKSKSGHSGKHK